MERGNRHDPSGETRRGHAAGAPDRGKMLLWPDAQDAPDDRDAGPMPAGWDEWLGRAALAPEESASILDELLTDVVRRSPVPAAPAVPDRIGMQIAFAIRSLRPSAERYRIFTEHLSRR
jgi:hypothetical protein